MLVRGIAVAVAFAIAGSHPGLAKGQKTSASGETLNQVLAKHTGQPLERITRDTERDRYLTAAEAKEYGLVDDVLEKMTEEKKQ